MSLVCTHGSFEQHCGLCKPDGKWCIDLPSDKRVVSHDMSFLSASAMSHIDGKNCLVIGLLDRVVSRTKNYQSAIPGEHVDGTNVLVLQPGWKVVTHPAFKTYTGGVFDGVNVALRPYDATDGPAVSVEWDLSNPESLLTSIQPISVQKGELKGEGTISQTITETVTVDRSITNTQERSISVSAGAGISGGIPLIGDVGGSAEVTITTTVSFSEAITESTSNSRTVSFMVYANVGPNETKQIRLIYTKGTMVVPGLFRVGQVAYPFKFKGVDYFGFRAEIFNPATHNIEGKFVP